MLSKILFTIFAVIAIWKAFSLVSRLQKEGGLFARDGDSRTPGANGESNDRSKAVEMVRCPRCGAYVDPKERCSCSG